MEVEQKNQQKSCLIEGHQRSDFVIMICLDKDCKQKSNTLCCECIYERLHNHCKYTLFCTDCRSNKFECRFNKEADKMKDYYNYLKSQQYKEIVNVEKAFQQIKDEFLEMLEKLIKEEKIKIRDYYGNLEQILQEKYNFDRKFQNKRFLQEVENQVSNYKDIEELNQFLQEFKQDKFFTSKEIEQISQLYKQTQQVEQDVQQELEQLKQDFHKKSYVINENFLLKQLFRTQKANSNKEGQQLKNGSFQVYGKEIFYIISRNFYSFKEDVRLKFKNTTGKKMDIGIKIYIMKGQIIMFTFKEDILFGNQDDYIQFAINLQEKSFQIELDQNEMIGKDCDEDLNGIDLYRIRMEITNYQKNDFYFSIK